MSQEEFLIEKIVFRHRYGYALVPIGLLLILLLTAVYLSFTGDTSARDAMLRKDYGSYVITFALVFLLHSSKNTLDIVRGLPSKIAEYIPDDNTVSELKFKIFKSKYHWLFYLLPIIFVPPLSVLFMVSQLKHLFGYQSNLYFAIAIMIWTLWWMFYLYAAYTAVVTTLLTFHLSRLEIDPDLFHPGMMGGLEPVGKLMLSSLSFSFWTFVLLFYLPYPVLKAGDQFTKFTLIIYIPLYFVFLTLCIYSLFKFHIALKTAKTNELNRVAELYRNERKQLRSKLKKKIPEEYISDFNKVRALGLILAEGEKMKEWLLDIKEWVKFAGYLLPLLEIASRVYGFLPRG